MWSYELAAIACVALLALLTGALHLDGLADVFDGLGGGRGDRTRTLAIMRDSRIGAHGAVALVLSLAAKVAATELVIEREVLFMLCAAPIAARLAVAPLIAWFPYARETGLGLPFHTGIRPGTQLAALLLALACLAPFGLRVLVPTVTAFALALAVAAWLARKLGGLTGDVYGAAIELSELAFLLAALFVHPL